MLQNISRFYHRRSQGLTAEPQSPINISSADPTHLAMRSMNRRGTDIEAQTREVTSTAANPTATTARGQGTPQIDDSPHGMNNQEHRSSYAPGPTETNASSSPAPATGRLQDPVREDPKIRKDNQDHRRRQRSEDLPLRPRGGTQQGNEAGSTAAAASPASCWESDAVMQAYRTAAARTVRRLSSALFGRELLAVEAARTSAAEREMMLEGRARALLDSQVLVGAIENERGSKPQVSV